MTTRQNDRGIEGEAMWEEGLTLPLLDIVFEYLDFHTTKGLKLATRDVRGKRVRDRKSMMTRVITTEMT